MKLLFIVGSMRKTSFNKELAHKAQELIGDRAEVSYLHYADIPFMNQDLEKEVPETIQRVRDEVKAADGIWIFTPEYNGMIPGVEKNLLDWLSRPLVPGNFASGTAVAGKPVTVSGVGGRNKTKGSRGQLFTLLKYIRMDLMEEPSCGFQLAPDSMKTDVWKMTPEQVEELNFQVRAFLDFVAEKMKY